MNRFQKSSQVHGRPSRTTAVRLAAVAAMAAGVVLCACRTAARCRNRGRPRAGHESDETPGRASAAPRRPSASTPVARSRRQHRPRVCSEDQASIPAGTPPPIHVASDSIQLPRLRHVGPRDASLVVLGWLTIVPAYGTRSACPDHRARRSPGHPRAACRRRFGSPPGWHRGRLRPTATARSVAARA